jgi:hypothetical protein
VLFWLAVVFVSAAAASMTWATPATVDRGTPLAGVACPSATQCTAVDDNGQELTFNPATPGGSPLQKVDSSGFSMTGIACPSATQCTAIDSGGDEVTFNPNDPGTPTAYSAGGVYSLQSVACPTTTQCTVLGYDADIFSFNPASFGSPASVSFNPFDLYGGLACPSTSECAGVTTTGGEVSVGLMFPQYSQPLGWTLYPIDGTNDLTGVTCSSTSDCTAIDAAGNEVTFNPAAPGSPTPYRVDGSGSAPTAVACASTSECVAVDSGGGAVAFDPAAPGTPPLQSIDSGHALTAVACASTEMCVAVDAAGDVIVGTSPPVSLTPPSITGTAVVGDVLSASQGDWLNNPTNYGYQWERCNSAGASCNAIAGATGKTYTLTQADAGSRFVVVATASNAGGPGSSASSSPTTVVLPTPPNAVLTGAKLNSPPGTARFKFKADGKATRFQCALVRVPSGKHARRPAPHYATCDAPKTYKQLGQGTYMFYVRAIGPGGTDETPATRRFTSL